MEMLRKFMDSFGLRLEITLDRLTRNSKGQKVVCMLTRIYRGEEIEYSQYFCYKLHRGIMVYDDGNKEKGVEDGILAYLGSHTELENHLDYMTRAKGRRYLEEFDF